MDEERGEKKDEENLIRKKEWITTGQRRTLIMSALWWVIYFVAVCIYPPLILTCNGWIATGIFFIIMYAFTFFFARIRKDREAMGLYFMLVFILAFMIVRSILDTCMSECP